MKKIFKVILGFVLVPSALVGALYSLEQNGFFNIDHIEIVVLNSLDQTKYLEPYIKNLDEELETFRGVSLWKIHLPSVDKKLSEKEWLEEAQISRQWPSRIRIELKIKEVKLLMMTHQGKFVPVVQDGETLPTVELKQAPDVALLQGDVFEKQPEVRKKVVQMMNEIPKEGSFSKKTISEIHFDEKEGFWMTLIKDGIRVKLGQDEVAMKSSRVSQVLDYMESRKIQARVIDANLNKKVVVRLRKDP